MYITEKDVALILAYLGHLAEIGDRATAAREIWEAADPEVDAANYNVVSDAWREADHAAQAAFDGVDVAGLMAIVTDFMNGDLEG